MTKKKDIPPDINVRRRPSTPRTAKTLIHDDVRIQGSKFATSKKVKKPPSAAEAKEFGLRQRIAKMAEKMPNVTGSISAMSVRIENGGQPDEEGRVRARINIGRGFVYVTVPKSLLEPKK